MALEVGSMGIRVNAVAPGPIQTGMLDRKRIGQPDEVAQAILYIGSSEAAFVTGHILTVDGEKSAG